MESQLTDVFCGPYTGEFDLRERNSAFGKQQWDHKISWGIQQNCHFSLLNVNPSLKIRGKSHFLPSHLPTVWDSWQRVQNYMVLEFMGLVSFLGKGQM